MSRRSSSGQKRSSTSGTSGSRGSDSTRKSKSSYDPNFGQNLIDSGVYPEGYETSDGQPTAEPGNLDAIRDALTTARASLSPSRFPESSFQEFKKANARAISETQAMTTAFAIIEGEGRHRYYSAGPDHPFNHLTPLSGTLPRPKPDGYDGVRPERIDQPVRDDLGHYIVPCNDWSRPAAPNFYIEGKSKSARPDVAKLQASHGGAVGARAMHHLVNHGRVEAEYDGNMRTYSTTYHPATSTLKLYGHHTTAPQAPGHSPQYHMSQLRGFDMTDSPERFREGATVFRNARELAESERNLAVQAANRATRHAPTSAHSTPSTKSRNSRSTVYEQESDTSIDELAAEELATKRQRHSAGKSTEVSIPPVVAKSATPGRHSVVGVPAPKRRVQLDKEAANGKRIQPTGRHLPQRIHASAPG